MTWRFSAAMLNDAEYVIFRDTDSRPSYREARAVLDWTFSGKSLHIMRDHPLHSQNIMGGMWGVLAPKARMEIAQVISLGRTSAVGEDQDLLSEHVYPKLFMDSMIHDTFFRRELHSIQFPEPRKNGEFIGERISEDGLPEIAMRKILNRYEKNWFLGQALILRDGLNRKLEPSLKFFRNSKTD
jgi:hypothetical protein